MNNLIRRFPIRNFYNYVVKCSVISMLPKNHQPYTRLFHSSNKLCIKLFNETENMHAYDIMIRNGYTYKLEQPNIESPLSSEQFESIMKTNWTKATPQEIFDTFPKLGDYCAKHDLCISDPIFDDFIDHLTDNIKNSTDHELKNIFASLCKWPETESLRSRNFIEVWTALDDECLKRLRQEWSHDTLLLFLPLFFKLNVSKASDFTVKAVQRLATRAKKLSRDEFVQTLFYIGLIRISPFDMHNLELRFNEIFSELTVNDMAIASMGFFKSRTPIRDRELINKIINKVILDVKDINEVSLAALLKLIRYSLRVGMDTHVHSLMGELMPEIQRLSIMCCVHIALVGTSTLTPHFECLDIIADKVSKNIQQTRMKDMERLILSFGTFNHKPNIKEDFFELVMKELRNPNREHEIQQHGKCFACCVSYLGLLGIYPKDLIAKVLDPPFLLSTYGKYSVMYGREILHLNNIAEIFLNESNIQKLSSKDKKLMSQKYTDYMPSETYKKQFNATEQMVLDVMRILQSSRGGSDYVLADHILTHYQRGDIIIAYDADCAPAPVRGAFTASSFGSVRRPPDGRRWVVLVVASKNVCFGGGDEVVGHLHRKTEELIRLGYYTEVIKWSVWRYLHSKEEKEEYINSVIDKALKRENKF